MEQTEKKNIGMFDIFSLGVGGAIGSGIFVMMGFWYCLHRAIYCPCGFGGLPVYVAGLSVPSGYVLHVRAPRW